MANELFSDPPSTHDAAVFLERDAELIQQAIEALQDDGEIREALTQALRVKAMVAFARGKRGREQLRGPIEKVKELETVATLQSFAEAVRSNMSMPRVETLSRRTSTCRSQEPTSRM